jgi:hypothetical protein
MEHEKPGSVVVVLLVVVVPPPPTSVVLVVVPPLPSVVVEVLPLDGVLVVVAPPPPPSVVVVVVGAAQAWLSVSQASAQLTNAPQALPWHLDALTIAHVVLVSFLLRLLHATVPDRPHVDSTTATFTSFRQASVSAAPISWRAVLSACFAQRLYFLAEVCAAQGQFRSTIARAVSTIPGFGQPCGLHAILAQAGATGSSRRAAMVEHDLIDMRGPATRLFCSRRLQLGEKVGTTRVSANPCRAAHPALVPTSPKSRGGIQCPIRSRPASAWTPRTFAVGTWTRWGASPDRLVPGTRAGRSR